MRAIPAGFPPSLRYTHFKLSGSKHRSPPQNLMLAPGSPHAKLAGRTIRSAYFSEQPNQEDQLEAQQTANKPASKMGTTSKDLSSGKASLGLTIIVILLWYACNIGVLILNKYLLSSTGFKQPVFLTLCHMIACVLMGLVVSASGIMPLQQLKSRNQLTKIAVLSVIFCLTIVLGNASLKYIPVSFNQMIGATTPFFTAILAFALQGARESKLTYLTLVPIAGGIALATGGEPMFHLIGFTCALIATASRALKSVVQSMLMTDPAEKLDPMSLLLYMSAFSVAILFPLSLYFEPTALTVATVKATADPGFFWWLVGNSLLAYFVNLTNFLVTKYTSALTLQVLGNAKGVVGSFVSVLVFKNVVTVQGWLGYAITVGGVFAYSESKRRFKVQKEQPKTQSAQEKEPLLGSNQV